MLLYTPGLFCKSGFYNICHLRLPGMPTFATPIHRLIAPDEAGEEAVATRGCGDGGRATTGAAERLVLFVKVTLLQNICGKSFGALRAFYYFAYTTFIFKNLFN